MFKGAEGEETSIWPALAVVMGSGCHGFMPCSAAVHRIAIRRALVNLLQWFVLICPLTGRCLLGSISWFVL